MSQTLVIEKAQTKHIDSIFELIKPYVEEKVILPRSKEDIATTLADTWVLSENDQVLASASLVYFTSNLCEVRALAVHKGHLRRGLGKKLMRFLLQSLRARNYEQPLRLFALTYSTQFFQGLGFKIVSKANYPEKVYEVCMFCAKKDDCREIAVELMIE